MPVWPRASVLSVTSNLQIAIDAGPQLRADRSGYQVPGATGSVAAAEAGKGRGAGAHVCGLVVGRNPADRDECLHETCARGLLN